MPQSISKICMHNYSSNTVQLKAMMILNCLIPFQWESLKYVVTKLEVD